MKRGIIYNNGHTIVIPDNEIWMTAWEIADLFYVTPNSINHAVKRVLKEGVLIEFQVCRYTCLENGNYADVYNIEMVIALSFRLNTGHSILFRRWLTQKTSTPNRSKIPILILLFGKKQHFCRYDNPVKPDLVQPFRAFFMLFSRKSLPTMYILYNCFASYSTLLCMD